MFSTVFPFLGYFLFPSVLDIFLGGCHPETWIFVGPDFPDACMPSRAAWRCHWWFSIVYFQRGSNIW